MHSKPRLLSQFPGNFPVLDPFVAAKESQSEYEASQSKEYSLEESIQASESASLFTSESLLVEQSEIMS